jgi:hypothetical protein
MWSVSVFTRVHSPRAVIIVGGDPTFLGGSAALGLRVALT